MPLLELGHDALDARQLMASGGLVPQSGRIAVYSCWFGRTEPHNPAALGVAGPWDRVIFTDVPELRAPGHRIVHLPQGFDGLSHKALSRLPKLRPELFFSAYDWTVYVDNRAILTRNAAQLVAGIEAAHGPDAPPGRYLFRHGQRRCAWREARVCRRMGHITEAEFAEITARFEAEGFPRDAGLFVNTSLIQKMGDAATTRLNAAWFEMFCAGASRDQILLPYVLWRSGLTSPVLDFPLEDVVRWPVFGIRVRHRYRRGRPLPDGWDARIAEALAGRDAP